MLTAAAGRDGRRRFSKLALGQKGPARKSSARSIRGDRRRAPSLRERGTGRPLVLLHGDGNMIQDFEIGWTDRYGGQELRVIVFDRPGFGRTSRPRNVIWSPEAQADLFMEALVRLNVQQAVVLGHSWGASIAIALAIRHRAFVPTLVLASGYYFPQRHAPMCWSNQAPPFRGWAISSLILYHPSSLGIVAGHAAKAIWASAGAT